MVWMDKRSYNEYCGLAKALDLVGERWTLLVVRNLLLGPLRYGDLLRGLPGITTNLLAKRLREMDTAGLVERVRGADTDGGHAYRLTALGQGLEPAVHALSRWGWRWMGTPGPGEHRSIEWLLVAMRGRYRGGVSLRAELVADDVPYAIILSPKRIDVTRGGVASPDLRIRGTAAGIARLFLGAGTAAGLAVEGRADRLQTLTGAFDWTPSA
jgi:DNA-binding HxlR family transcriptional regulator